jgi:hypothetical protein
MKKNTALLLALLVCSVGMFESVSCAQGPGAGDTSIVWGVNAKASGCFCCVKQTCVVARNEADCKKIGGIKVKTCADCEKGK